MGFILTKPSIIGLLDFNLSKNQPNKYNAPPSYAPEPEDFNLYWSLHKVIIPCVHPKIGI